MYHETIEDILPFFICEKAPYNLYYLYYTVNQLLYLADYIGIF